MPPLPAVPRNLEQATTIAQRVATVDAYIDTIEAECAGKVADAKAAADALIAPLLAEREALAGKLESWWARAGAQLLKGRRKSIEIGGCKLGTRAQAAKLTHSLADDKAAVAALQGAGKRSLLKASWSLDRTKILAGLQGRAAEVLKGLSFAIDEGGDTFFVSPLDGASVAETQR